MRFKNILYVYTKRIFAKKMYLFIMLILALLVATYPFLPSKSTSSDINVSICILDDSPYGISLKNKLADISSVYTFKLTASKDDVINDVKSGKFECGFFVPKDFFSSYIIGSTDIKVEKYTTPSSTLGEAITESLFVRIYKLCSKDILLFAANSHELDDVLLESMDGYLNGDEIFRIKDNTTGKMVSLNSSYTITLPVFEISIILVTFSAFLGLLTFLTDNERNIFIALKPSNRFMILLASVISAVAPVCLVGALACLITYPVAKNALFLLAFSVISIIASIALRFIIRKSTLFTKVLPVLMLICISVVFVSSLI